MAKGTKDVNVDGNEIINLKQGFGDDYQVIDEKIKKIEEVLLMIQQAWSGVSADAYVKDLKEKIDLLNAYKKALSQLIDELMKCGYQYKETEDSILEHVKSIRFYK